MSKLRDAILAKKDAESERHFVPEWGAEVEIRAMNGRERERFELGHTFATESCSIRATLVAASCYDPETGEKLFAPEDVEALNDKSAQALDRLFDVARRLSGISRQDVEDLEKK